MQNRVGKCHICGKYGPLSKEHVPPQKAFNADRAFTHMGMQALKREGYWPWDLDSMRGGKQHQNGVGFYTLCVRCNNLTGGWYGGAFVHALRVAYQSLLRQAPVGDKKEVEITLRGTYPLRVFKQILSMFCSINGPDFIRAHPGLREALLNKETKIAPPGYRIFAYVITGKVSRYIGMSGAIGSTGNRVLSELSAPPFGYVLEINPSESVKSLYSDITFFGRAFGYQEKRDITLTMPVLESNTLFPADYRSREEIMAAYVENKLREIYEQP